MNLINEEWRMMAIFYRHGNQGERLEAMWFYTEYYHLWTSHLNALAVIDPECYEFEADIWEELANKHDPVKNAGRRVYYGTNKCLDVIKEHFGG